MATCKSIPEEVLAIDAPYEPESAEKRSRFWEWLQCYSKGAHVQDAQKRTVWFFGSPGPLYRGPPPKRGDGTGASAVRVGAKAKGKLKKQKMLKEAATDGSRKRKEKVEMKLEEKEKSLPSPSPRELRWDIFFV